jgi:hypothetical protein
LGGNTRRHFEVGSALKVRRPDKLRRLTGVKQAIECPFEEKHTTPGGQGTFAVDSSKGLPQIASGFTLQCSHNACAGRALLPGMQGWLAESDLTGSEFLSAGPDIAAGLGNWPMGLLSRSPCSRRLPEPHTLATLATLAAGNPQTVDSGAKRNRFKRSRCVFAKLFEDRLEGRLEAETFSRR